MAAGNKEWTTIESLAALGTSRASQPLEGLWPDASIAIPAASPERTLLRVAASRYLWTLAGARSSAVRGMPSPAAASASEHASHRIPDAPSAAPLPTETGSQASLERGSTVLNESPSPASEIAPPLEEKLVSEQASWRMARMLNGEHRELLKEWFSLAAREERVLAPQWLPVVLDALKPADLIDVAPVLGRRAVWLAARNPAWQLRDAEAAPSEERWSTGTLAERVADLTSLRKSDPAAARAWVEKTWEVDPPEAREAFVQAFLHGLSTDDEPFLESALRDKRKAVRVAAMEALARLPASAFSQRNLARLEPLLKFDLPNTGLIGKLKKRRLHVELPTALDKAATKDGIESAPPASRKIGERTWWLAQMLALAPPSHWTTKFDIDPRTLIDAVLDTDYAAELFDALIEAASRHCDEAWLAALLEKMLAEKPSPETESTMVELITAAPVTMRERLLAQALTLIDNARFPLALALLNSSAIDWSPAITKRAFELLSHRVRNEPQQYTFPRNTLAEWGVRAHADIAVAEIERVDARCPDPSPWRNAVEALRDIIEFRAAMRQELLT